MCEKWYKMELVQSAFNNLPIVILLSSVVVFIKETLFNFLSLEFVKQTLKTIFGLTPREAGDIIIISAKHIAVIIKTSTALVLNVVKNALQFISFILPNKIVEVISNTFNTTVDLGLFGYIGDFFAEMFVKMFTGFANLIKLFIYLVPQLFTFLETIFNILYKIGQGFYAIFAALNSGWVWFQSPLFSNRIIIIFTILMISVSIIVIGKFAAWTKKKIE